MTKEQKQILLEGLHNSAWRFERESHGCAQATVKALHDYFPINDIVFKIASPCSGGMSNSGIGPCGGFLGGVLVLGYFFGRDIQHTNMSGREFRDRVLVNQLRERFQSNYSGLACREVQAFVFGHSFDLFNEEDKERFELEGGHTTVCPGVVGEAAKWVAEILLKEGIQTKPASTWPRETKN